MSIIDAVAMILAHPAPMIFLDTCSLLDIIRAPMRNSALAIRAAEELSTGVRRTPPTVYLAIGQPTPREWDDHVDEAVADCGLAVNAANAVSEALGFLGVGGMPPLAGFAMALPGRLRALSRGLRDASIRLDKDFETLDRAYDRLVNADLPARKGGRGAKDALIMEQALGLTRSLRAHGFAPTCLFVSSNTTDFAEKNPIRLHPSLAPLFASTNLHYEASLDAAVDLLRGEGWAP